MEGKKEKNGCVIKAVLVMYIVTGLLLVLLAVLVKNAPNEDMVARVGVMGIYVLSCGLGGFLIGKWKKKQKYLWGLLAGAVYVLVLMTIGMIIGKGALPNPVVTLSKSMICLGAGMLGGMIS